MSNHSSHDEAIRAAARHHELTPALTPKLSALIRDLRLVDVARSKICCQSRCANGGDCGKAVEKNRVARCTLRLLVAALDGGLAGDALEREVGGVYAEMMCGTPGHCTDAQVARCGARARLVLEAWRRQWVVAPTVAVTTKVCPGCAVLEAERDEMFAESLKASAKCEKLVVKRDAALEQVYDMSDERDEAVTARLEAEADRNDFAGKLRKALAKIDALWDELDDQRTTRSVTHELNNVNLVKVNEGLMENNAGLAERNDELVSRVHKLETEAKTAEDAREFRETTVKSEMAQILADFEDLQIEHEALQAKHSGLLTSLAPAVDAYQTSAHKQASIVNNATPSTTQSTPSMSQLKATTPPSWLRGMLGKGNGSDAAANKKRGTAIPTPGPTSSREDGNIRVPEGFEVRARQD